MFLNSSTRGEVVSLRSHHHDCHHWLPHHCPFHPHLYFHYRPDPHSLSILISTVLIILIIIIVRFVSFPCCDPSTVCSWHSMTMRYSARRLIGTLRRCILCLSKAPRTRRGASTHRIETSFGRRRPYAGHITANPSHIARNRRAS